MQTKTLTQYKLKQPEKNKQSPGYWVFAALLMAFVLYIVLINPLLTWPFDRPGEIGRLEYGLLTSGAILLGGLITVPFILQDRRFQKTMGLLWANRNYVTHEEWMALSNEHKIALLKGNDEYIQRKLQTLVNQHDGKDMRVYQYKMNPKFAEDLSAEASSDDAK